jgi:P27 family predicted phage terminase small subunit
MPRAIAKVHGYKQKKSRRAPGKEPVVHVGTPALPASVRDDQVALDCWKRTRGHLMKMKVLTLPDGIALEGMCIAYSRAQRADRLVNSKGLLLQKFDGSLTANPAVAVSMKAWAEVRKFAQEFGLTPSSRTRVREAPPEPDSGSKSDVETPEDFLFKKGRIVGSIGR